jgi:hypothetical protein
MFHTLDIVRPWLAVIASGISFGGPWNSGVPPMSLNQITKLRVKLGDGHRPMGDFRLAPTCCLPDHGVVDEIKEDLNTCRIWNE